MHIGWSELDRKGNLIGYKLEVDGIPVAFDALTLELLEELLQDADGISIFGDEGDIQPEIEEVAEQFFVTMRIGRMVRLDRLLRDSVHSSVKRNLPLSEVKRTYWS